MSKRSFGGGIRAGVRRLLLFVRSSDGGVRASLRSEIEAHVEARIAYLIARGTSPDDARRIAIDRFGGDLDTAIRQLTTSAESTERTLRTRDHVASVLEDIRFVLRGLGRAPTFTAGVVITLALGLGINSAVFRVADRVLTRAPGGVVGPAALRRLALVQPQSGPGGAPMVTQQISYPPARAATSIDAFAGAGLYATVRNVQRPDGRDLAAIYVDSGYFHTLGARPFIGRFFDASEAEPGANIPVVVASYEFWKRELGGASLQSMPPLRLGDKAYRVIGVAQRDFNGIDLDPVDVWLPFGVAVLGRGEVNGVEIPWYRMSNIRSIRAFVRLAPNVSSIRAATQASAALPAAENSYTVAFKGVQLLGLHESMGTLNGDASERLLGRLVLVAFVVLVIACANAANLLLARGLRRRRELAVRSALGAGRGRIVRLLLLESAVLSLGGGIAAALTGYWMGDALRRLVLPGARWSSTPLDDRVLAFTLGAALVSGLAAGLVPALQLTSPDLVTGLKDNRYVPGRRTHRTRATLIVVQTAFSLCLLIATGLLVRSLQRLVDVDLGFDDRDLVTVEISSTRFNFGPPVPGRVGVLDIAPRVEKLPGIAAIALSSNAPFGSHASMTVTVPGRPDPDIPPFDGPWYSSVSANFFKVMGMRVVKGRGFEPTDIQGAQPVAVVNETMARDFWSDADPFKSCLLARGVCARVVGIVRDVRDFHSDGSAPPRYYFPLAQQDDSTSALVIRAAPHQATHIAQLIKPMIPAAQRITPQIISDRVDQAMQRWRVAALLFATIGAIALVLSCVGVYSVMSYIASERVPELGIRLVLGATSGGLVRLVAASGLRLVLVGIVVGVCAAALGARLLSALLFRRIAVRSVHLREWRRRARGNWSRRDTAAGIRCAWHRSDGCTARGMM